MAKKSIILILLLLVLFFFGFFFYSFIYQVNAQIICDGGLTGSVDPCGFVPPPPPPIEQPNPNPTSAVSAQNRKCWDAGGSLITDDCVPCGSAVASNCQLFGECGSCGGGSSVCTGGCVQSHEECSWQTCPEEDCASGICSWNVDRTWCRSWDCTPACDLWLPAGTCANRGIG